MVTRTQTQNGSLSERSTPAVLPADSKSDAAALREERAFTDLALNAQRDTFFVLDIATGQAVRWNRAFRDISGYTDEEIAAAKTPENYYSPSDQAKATAVINRVLAGETVTVEIDLITKDGTRIPTEYRVSPILDDGDVPTHLIAIGRDITDRRHTEAALRESEQRFRLLIENIPSVAWVTDENGNTSYVSPNIEKVYGFTMEEILAGGDRLWRDRIHPADRVRFHSAFQDLVSAQTPFEVDYRIRHKDGHWIWLHDRAETLKIVGGKTYVLGVFSDITERKLAEAEKARLEEQLHQSEKMEAVGQLAGGVAHDFNNQLGGILGFADLLRELVREDPVAVGFAENIILATERAADLTAKLLAFARKGKYVEAPVDLNALVSDVTTILAHSTDKRVTIRTDRRPDVCHTLGEASQLQSALLNLGINACHAMPAGGELLFKTEIVTLDADACERSLFAINPGRFVSITVQDTGVGMSAEILEHIFEPFFTTKAPGKGTGMGLAAVYGTVTNHHGSIEVESILGTGTTFRLLLPLHEHGERAEDSPVLPPRAVGAKTILFVDDEPLIRETAMLMLESLGYRVLLAQDGEEAIRLYESHGHEIALVVLDVVMPKCNGRETFEAIRDRDPAVKVLVSTGFSLEGDAERILAMGATSIITKPFRKRNLAEKIAAALVD